MSDSTILHKEWYTWIGQGVSVGKGNTGTLKYFGEIKSKCGFWCGVELDDPMGNSDGMMCNVQYFKCKTNHGVFVPVHEVTMLQTRNIELNCVSNLSKLKLFEDKDGLDNGANKKIVTGNLDKTFVVNIKNESKHVNFAEDERCINTCKRSKNSAGRFGTEESLGILSSLLDEDGSWNLLDHSNAIREQCDIQNISDDSVFFPTEKAPLPNKKKPYCYAQHIDNPIQNGLSIKCTSTPKNCLNVFDLGATVKLNDDQFYDFLEVEIEPIIAGSTDSKSMDLDLTKFEQNDILCSTSKLCIPVLPPEFLVLDKEAYIKSEDFNESDIKLKDHTLSTSTTSHECIDTSKFIHGTCKPENSDILNTTYKIDPEILKNPIASISLNVEDSCLDLGLNINSDKKYIAMDLNSTFVMPDNACVKNSNHADKTFIIDYSPRKVIEQTLSPVPDLIFEKKSLSIIFEKASNENLSKIGAAECNELFSTSDSALKRNNNTNINSPKHFSESIDELLHSLNSTKIMNKEEFTSDLNSTFFLNIDESNHEKNAYQDASKRYSLSSISEKNNTPAYKKNSNIATRKSIKPPESFFSKKTIFKTSMSPSAVSISATKHTKDIKNLTVSALSNKIENKNVPKDSLRLCSKLSTNDNLKVKYASPATASASQNIRKTLNPCKVLDSKNVQDKNAPHLALKINKNYSKISTTRRKSLASLETKAIPKMFYNSKKIGISEHLNFNGEVNGGAGSSKINSRNQIVATHSTITRRHTMLPAILANKNPAKITLCKSKSDLSTGTSTVAKSTIKFTNNQSAQSLKIPQCGIGNKKEDVRASCKTSAPARVKAPGNDSKDFTNSEDRKNENKTIPKRGLLKPGTLSRLPVFGKSIKKPSCIPNAVNPQHGVKNSKDTKERLPLWKLQDQYS